MSQPSSSAASYSGRYRSGYGRPTTGLVLALLAEGLLILLVLTLGAAITDREIIDTVVTEVRFKAVTPDQRKPVTEEEETPEPAKPERPPPAEPEKAEEPKKAEEPEKEVRPVPKPTPTPPQVIKLSPKEAVSADIAAKPEPKPPAPVAAAKRPKMGPPDTGSSARDTPRVGGSGPNGEPLYAASWYREPYEDELRGYLSTASGPGWGLIACRTAPDFRVEDCVEVDEYPTGSNIARSVLAAAWQFRVRPPRVGGQPKIGEWVRIRISYDMQRKAPPYAREN